MLALTPTLAYRFAADVKHPEPISETFAEDGEGTSSSASPTQEIYAGLAADNVSVADDGGIRYDIGNTLIIDKINLQLDIVQSESAEALERGTWHRWPKQGDPEIGNNFILTGHRFGFDWTPEGVARNSAFYQLDKLVDGDVVTVYWNQRKYEYVVDGKHTAHPNASWIEAPSEEHRLTLYTCTLGGESDGRVVLTAKPIST